MPDRREPGLRNSCIGETPAHGDLVGHQMSCLGPDAGEAACLCDGGDDRHGAVGRERHYAAYSMPAPDFGDVGDVSEIDHLGCICDGEARRLRISVDRDDPDTELLDAHERATLVPAGAHEQHRGLERHFLGVKRKACLSQREISQPFVRSNRVFTPSSRYTPCTDASWSPPCCSVQRASSGVSANGCSTSSSRSQACSGSGKVPPGGSQRSVQVFALPVPRRRRPSARPTPPAGGVSSQLTIRRSVTMSVGSAGPPPSLPQPARKAKTNTRLAACLFTVSALCSQAAQVSSEPPLRGA